MRHAAVTLAAVVLLLAGGVGAAELPAGRATPMASSDEGALKQAWAKDPAAKEFFQYGVRCGKGPGPDGLDLLEATPILQAHASEGPRPDDPSTDDKPLEKMLAVLSAVGIAQSEAPDAQQARARYPRIAEAYRLYHLLKDAPPDRQGIYIDAFAAGISLGAGGTKETPNRQAGKLGARATPSRPQSHRAGTGWQKDRLAKQFYSFGVRCAKGDAFLEGKVPALRRRVTAYLKRLPAGATYEDQFLLGGTPEKTLRTLSVFLGADSDLPEIRQARARYSQMVMADRLYHLLKRAPLHRQEQCAAAFQAGLTQGVNEVRRADELSMAKERADEKRRLAAHLRLTKEVLARTPDDDLEEAIMDYVTNKIGDHWDRYYAIVSRLPKPIQMVFAISTMEGQIDGDGFEEFSDWEFAPLAAAGYRLVGAPRHAELVERAAVFVPKEKQKEEDVLKAGGEPDESNKTIEVLDDEFDALDKSEDVYPLITRYIRAHLDQFVAD